MTNQTMVYYKVSETYGGYDYIEVDHNKGVFIRGNSRSHSGHASRFIKVEVKTLKGLRKLADDLKIYDYKEVRKF